MVCFNRISFRGVSDLPFPSSCPDFEHLELGDNHPSDNFFLPVTILEVLELTLRHNVNCPPFPSIIPTYTLTSLPLNGKILDRLRPPDCIQSPVLTTLTLKAATRIIF